MRMRTGTRGDRRTGLVALLAVLVVTVAAFAASSASVVGRAESERLFASAYAEHARRLARTLGSPAYVDLEREGGME